MRSTVAQDIASTQNKYQKPAKSEKIALMSELNKVNKFIYASVAAVILAVGAYVFVGTGVTTAPESTFVLLDGSKINTASLKGKVTLVNFWATSCTTCVAEMPKVIATYDKYKSKGFDTVAVAMSYDPPAYVVNYVETRKLPFKVAIDNTGAVAKAWDEVRLTPTTYIVNKQGQIVKRYVGEPDFTELHALIEKLLAAS
jgi:peroxiredoxin